MSNLKIRPGIVLISICDEHILVSTREAREFCPYVQQINNVAVYYWKLLEDEMEMKDIIDKASEHFGLTKINTLIHLNELIKKLTSAGYLIEED